MTHSLLPRLLSVLCLLATLAASLPAASPARATGAQAGTWYVATTGDDSNDCATPATPCATINAAIGKAADGDTIKVATGTYFDGLAIAKDITFLGGWNTAFSTQSSFSTIDGQQTRRPVYIGAEATVRLEQFHILNGDPGDWATGGGLSNQGQTTLHKSLLANNRGHWGGGAIYNFLGVITITQSALTNNSSFNGGGGIFNEGGAIRLINSTISHNQTSGAGGGILNRGYYIGTPGVVSLYNSTIAGNTAYLGGGLYTEPATEPLYNLTLAANSIIASNTSLSPDVSSPDCGGPLQSTGYNLIGATTGCTLAGSAGDILGVSAKLGDLTDSGGFTPIHSLQPGSPAINAANPAGCTDNLGQPLLTDQRGAPRMSRCDIGAYEAGLSAAVQTTGLVRAGNTVTCTVILQNLDGGMDLSPVMVTNTLPAQLSPIVGSFTSNDGVGAINGQTVSWTGTVMSTTSTILTYRAAIDPSALGQLITNTVISSWSGIQTTSSAILDTYTHLYLPLTSRNYCLDFFEDFSSPATRWYTGDDAYLLAQVVNGEYRLYTKVSDIFLIAAPTCPREHYTVETDVRWAASSSDSYGLLFGLNSDWSRFYFLDVNPYFQGFRLFRYDDASGFSLVAGPYFTPYIVSGLGSNHLAITRNGSQISVILNNVLLGNWYDAASLGLTRAGVMVLSYDDEPVADARFDNFRVTSLNSGALAAGADDVGLPTLLPATPAGSARPLPDGADWPWPTLDQVRRAFETR